MFYAVRDVAACTYTNNIINKVQYHKFLFLMNCILIISNKLCVDHESLVLVT